jgi:hypothetical protein
MPWAQVARTRVRVGDPDGSTCHWPQVPPRRLTVRFCSTAWLPEELLHDPRMTSRQSVNERRMSRGNHL